MNKREEEVPLEVELFHHSRIQGVVTHKLSKQVTQMLAVYKVYSRLWLISAPTHEVNSYITYKNST